MKTPTHSASESPLYWSFKWQRTKVKTSYRLKVRWERVYLLLLPALGTLFLPLVALFNLIWKRYPVLVYIILSGLAVDSWRSVLFWRENGEWMWGKGVVVGSQGRGWREEKLWSECIIWEKNLFLIKIIVKSESPLLMFAMCPQSSMHRHLYSQILCLRQEDSWHK